MVACEGRTVFLLTTEREDYLESSWILYLAKTECQVMQTPHRSTSRCKTGIDVHAIRSLEFLGFTKRDCFLWLAQRALQQVSRIRLRKRESFASLTMKPNTVATSYNDCARDSAVRYGLVFLDVRIDAVRHIDWTSGILVSRDN